MADDKPVRVKGFNDQVVAGGRAHPVIGWVVLGMGIGGAIGASNGAMGVSLGLGAAIGFGVGVFVTRGLAQRRRRRDAQ